MRFFAVVRCVAQYCVDDSSKDAAPNPFTDSFRLWCIFNRPHQVLRARRPSCKQHHRRDDGYSDCERQHRHQDLYRPLRERW
jgi:hypothetical protein